MHKPQTCLHQGLKRQKYLHLESTVEALGNSVLLLQCQNIAKEATFLDVAHDFPLKFKQLDHIITRNSFLNCQIVKLCMTVASLH